MIYFRIAEVGAHLTFIRKDISNIRCRQCVRFPLEIKSSLPRKLLKIEMERITTTTMKISNISIGTTFVLGVMVMQRK